tara:strand:- start:540 stop:1298 length:759 start_codon:yes stop_codon:yes gene_type:complete
MKYLGSKARFVKHLKPIIEEYLTEGVVYVEPFAGGCNLICDIDHNVKIANDYNKPLIECFKVLQGGWIPPKNITRECYNHYRNLYNKDSCPEDELHIMGYIGINGSYGGRWFDGGYAGISTTKQGKLRNYPEEAFNNVMKQIPKLQGIEFHSVDYLNLDIPDKSVVYCDIPYKGTKEYRSAIKSGFCHDKFFDWCKNLTINKGCTVLLSEYQAPSEWECIWEKSTTSSMRANNVISGAKNSIERLFIYKGEN